MAEYKSRKRKDPQSQRFRYFTSDRSGFDYGFVPITELPNAYTREGGRPTLDVGVNGSSLVAPSEIDSPPPSKRPLGGADIASDNTRLNSGQTSYSDVYTVPTESTKIIVYVNSSTSINWNQQPTVYISGSNVSQVMAVNPQLVAGAEGQRLVLECVGSSITLVKGSGITYLVPTPVIMNSGGISCFMYHTDGTAWNLTSFNAYGGF